MKGTFILQMTFSSKVSRLRRCLFLKEDVCFIHGHQFGRHETKYLKASDWFTPGFPRFKQGNEKHNNRVPSSLSLFDKLRARHDRFVKIIRAFRRCSVRLKQAGEIFSRILGSILFYLVLFSHYLFKTTPHSNCFIYEVMQVFST